MDEDIKPVLSTKHPSSSSVSFNHSSHSNNENDQNIFDNEHTKRVKGIGGGVADYFAILGVGENMILKSTKSVVGDRHCSSRSNSCHENRVKNLKENDDVTIDEEMECSLTERFYREIVEISLLTIRPGFSRRILKGQTGNNLVYDFSGTLATSSSADKFDYVEVDDTASKYEDLIIYDDSPSQVEKICNIKSKAKFSRKIPLNESNHVRPDPRFINITFHTNTKNKYPCNRQSFCNGIEIIPPSEVAGFKIIWRTRPAANISSGIVESSSDTPDYNKRQWETTNDMETTLNVSNISPNNTIDSTSIDNFTISQKSNTKKESSILNKRQEIWQKYETVDANMHPLTGMYHTLLSIPHVDDSATEFELATTVENNTKRKYKNNVVSRLRKHLPILAGTVMETSGCLDESNSGFSTVGTYLESSREFQTKGIDSIFNIIQRSVVDDLTQIGKGEFHEKVGVNKFYLGYRRRGADECDRPGIADVVVRYVRIHADTIIRKTSSQTNSSNDSKASTELHKDKSENTLGVDSHSAISILGRRKRFLGGESARKGADLLRKHLITGASFARSGGRILLRHSKVRNETMICTENRCNRGSNETKINYDLIDKGIFNNPTIPSIKPVEQSFSSSPDLSGNVANQETTADLNNHTSERSGNNVYQLVNLEDFIDLPEGYDEWVIPDIYHKLRMPLLESTSSIEETSQKYENNSAFNTENLPILSSSPLPKLISQNLGEKSMSDINEKNSRDKRKARRRMHKTFLFPHSGSPTGSSIGMEATWTSSGFSPSASTCSNESPNKWTFRDSRIFNPWYSSPLKILTTKTDSPLIPIKESHRVKQGKFDTNFSSGNMFGIDSYIPTVISPDMIPAFSASSIDDTYEYVPIIAVRRQRVGNEERFHEDPTAVDMTLTFLDHLGKPIIPIVNDNELDYRAGDNKDRKSVLDKTEWSASCLSHSSMAYDQEVRRGLIDPNSMSSPFGLPTVLLRKNISLGFADSPFSTSVLDRFPEKDSNVVPFPQEELPMFCYPTGCLLHRARYQDAPLPESYGFVVKNERGDNIHISCVSFMEPLTRSKIEQLDSMTERMSKTSLPHRFHSQKYKNRKQRDYKITKPYCNKQGLDENINPISSPSEFEEENGYGNININYTDNDTFLTGFNQMTTFENKTICLISRYPFWTAFRRFLFNLYVLSGSSFNIPLERFISHLLLSIPVPKPGSQCILMPLPALTGPMVLTMPPTKDLPLVDIPYSRLFSCLDVPTVVTIVIGFLLLEKKVIIMSSYPSLVSDTCELLRLLLFPFELCAPYVPRLTQPFMSCLEFPGAIFVGIHDNSDNGLASTVRNNIPEGIALVDLDTGDIDCNGDRYGFLRDCWDIIPSEPRSILVSEVEMLCRDANIIPGQEPIGPEIEVAFDSSLSTFLDNKGNKQLDDRGIRDCFLRFFCSLLGGYERFLVVPDVDFLKSGNEWFDTEGFLKESSSSRVSFLQSLVSTQLFQLFIQRRTEASDVHCLLFDECLNEYHSSKIPYGRLGVDERIIRSDVKESTPQYNLLIDECAADTVELPESDEPSTVETSLLTSTCNEEFMLNNSGDLVTMPSCRGLQSSRRFVYCVDGNPCFPQKLNPELFLPREPDFLSTNLTEILVPVLTRSDREKDESKRRLKMAVSHHGVQRQRRCLFQLPKLLGSHVLGTWLMCIPSQISQPNISLEQQSKYLLRALGALRFLRSRQKIVADEAGYRCLIVACGRAGSDRRVELVQLFGLLRSDGIFPSAVTLGQYTRAIAEGYSKRSFGISDTGTEEVDEIEIVKDDGVYLNLSNVDFDSALDMLDNNLVELEMLGKRWKQKRESSMKCKPRYGNNCENNMRETFEKLDQLDYTGKTPPYTTKLKKIPLENKGHKIWSPVTCSSSFSPWKNSIGPYESNILTNFKFFCLWSHITKCPTCFYTPLDEEIQGGWDNDGDDNETISSVPCPHCGAMLHPQLGYREMNLDDATKKKKCNDSLQASKEDQLPPQLQTSYETEPLTCHSLSGFVPYLRPSKLRLLLENHIQDNGEEALHRDRLRETNPIVFFNLWWFSGRLSLPLPLSITQHLSTFFPSNNARYAKHWCAFIAWDESVAKEGCRSAAIAIMNLIELCSGCNNEDIKYVSSQNLPLIKNVNSISKRIVLSKDFSLLSHFNHQSFTQEDWDHPDLSTILIRLVEACDKRQFQSVVECVLQSNQSRLDMFGEEQGAELCCYHTILYLSRYQCTSAFLRFFPATVKVCKGYHFWCANGITSIFDRLFRDAVNYLKTKKKNEPAPEIHIVSDIALGFRCVFGHII